jgi:hypothetical protein
VRVYVDVLETFPLDLSAPVRWDRRKTVVVSRAEDRTRRGRVKDKDGLAFQTWEASIGNLEVDEVDVLDDFWDRHHPTVAFIFDDDLRTARRVIYFDSDISYEAGADCAINAAFRFIEK